MTEPPHQSMTTGRSDMRRWTELAFIAALLTLAAAWLILFRERAWLHTVPSIVVFYIALATLTALWARTAARATPSLPHPATTAAPAWHRTEALFVLSALACLTWVCFWGPLKMHFWGGYDDVAAVSPASPWNARQDELQNRPMGMLMWWVAQCLTPNRIEGRLWVAAGLCFLNSALVYAIIRRVSPRSAVIAMCAAVLLLVSRGDEARFYVLWATVPHWGPQCLLLLGTWLLLVSHALDSRVLLVAACFVVSCALLISEGVYPLAMLAPVLLGMAGARGQRFVVWSIAWVGTVMLLALRLVLFLVHHGAETYQAKQSADAMGDPTMLLHNLEMHLAAVQSYFTGYIAVGRFWEWALVAFVVTAAACAIVQCIARVSPTRRDCLRGMAVAAVVTLLGTLPFLHIAGLFRTHLLAAPGEAAFLMFTLGWLTTFLPQRMRPWCMGICTSVLVAGGTAALHRSQERSRAAAHVFFEKTAHVFQQVHALSPKFEPDAAIIFILDDGIIPPLGQNDHVRKLGQAVLGRPAFQANATFAPGDRQLVFSAEGARAERYADHRDISYDRLIAFRLSADGTVFLLRELPMALLPQPNRSAAYNPFALMKAGPVAELPFLRLNEWMRRMPDILDSSPSMGLGGGWSELRAEDKRVFRIASNEAELVVNPCGETARNLQLEIEPPSSGTGPWELQALDTNNEVVGRAPLTARSEIRLAATMDPARVQVLRLRLVSRTADGREEAAPAFRVFRPGKRSKAADLPVATGKDVVGPGLRVGANWHPFERFAGLSFRWVSNDAEILPGALSSSPCTTLACEVMPGPGIAQQPCRVQLLDTNGAVLGSASFEKRETIRFSLPRPLTHGDVLRLHVENGGAPTPGDPRLLNLMVFSCGLVE